MKDKINENEINDKKAISYIQEKLLINLERLNEEEDDLKKEISRSKAISQIANTYIKVCNMKIVLENIENNK